MKKLFTYCFMLTAFAAQAKENKGRKPSEAMRHPLVQQVMEAQLSRSSVAAKTTAADKRLLSHSYRLITQGVLADTSKAWYSGNRHSGKLAYRNFDQFSVFPGENIFGSGYLMNDSAINFSALSGPFGLARKRYINYTQDSMITRYDEQYFNNTQQTNYLYEITRASSGRVESYDFHQGLTPGATNYQHLQTTINTYDTQGVLIADTAYGYFTGIPTVYTIYTYTSAGLQSVAYSFALNGSSWDSTARTTYTYNSIDRLTGIISEGYMNGTWLTAAINTMSYDSDDRMVTSFFSADFFGTGNLQAISKDTFAYTGTFAAPVFHESYEWLNGQWELFDKQTYTLNSAGNQDTVWYYNIAQGVATIDERDPIHYDADGYVTHINGYEYNATTQTYATTPYDENRYYYEVVNDVPSIEGRKDMWAVYPNPAAQYITIRSTAKEPFIATLYNVTGQQLVKQQYQPYGTVQLNINTVPAGIYMLQLSDMNGAPLHSQQLIKQ